MAGQRDGVCKETDEKVMIENNRNHINMQSYSTEVLWEGCRKWSQISGQCDQISSKTSIMIMMLITRSNYRL